MIRFLWFCVSSQITADQIPSIDAKLKKVFAQRQKIDRIEVSKNDLLELFSYNEFKLREVEKIATDKTAVYRCGAFIDLSPIPLLRHTKKIKVIKVLKVRIHIEIQKRKKRLIRVRNWDFFQADPINAEKLQRVHAASFPTEQQLFEFERKQKN